MQTPSSAQRTLSVAAALAGLASLAPAQVASSILNEGAALPGQPGHTVSFINNTAVNEVGGYAVTVNSTDGVTTLSQSWGSADGVAAPTVLFQETTVGPLVQTSWESFFGLGPNGETAYSASGTGGPDGSFDSAWVDGTAIAVEGDPSSVAGEFWSFASRPGITTTTGDIYFVGGTRSTVGGTTSNRGLFFGASATPVLYGGDSVTNLPMLLSVENTVAFDARYSSEGNHYLAEVQMDLGPTVDNAMVMDDAGLLLDGTLVQEGNLVPVAIGGDGTERWENFDFVGVTEIGRWFFSGNTDAAAATDEFICRDGVIEFREGQMIDGFVVSGAIEGASMNRFGQIAYIWDVDDVGGNVEALFIEDQLLLKEGDLVDLDNDGIVEANSVLANFTGISALTAGPDARLYFTADIDVNGTPTTTDDIEGFFVIDCEGVCPPLAYCVAGLTTNGCVPSISGVGTPSATSGSGFDVVVGGVEGQKQGILFYGISGKTSSPWGMGASFLCVKAPTQRTPAQNSGGTVGACDGVLSLDFNLYIASNPTALGQPFAAGDSVWVQGWFRDPPSPKTTNLSDGLEFSLQP